MKLAVIVPVLNQFDISRTTLDFAINYLDKPADVIVLDNASDEPFTYKKDVAETRINTEGTYEEVSNIQIVRLDHNIGVYPTFWEALKHTDADVLAFFHSDLILTEKGWDTRVLAEFEKNPKLGLLGFIGSDEIDASGGRGLGTTSNFQGAMTARNLANGGRKAWHGSPAEAHGKRNSGYTKAAVVDGCAMIFRREVLEQIEQRPDFPLHHFYDRLLSCEVQEKGYEVGVLGIGCDHISGQTVNQENAYHKAAREWAVNHETPFVYNLDIISRDNTPTEADVNWDATVYKEAERQWLNEYRDIKHFIPIHV
jgi:GT2 family glycosyltransferase